MIKVFFILVTSLVFNVEIFAQSKEDMHDLLKLMPFDESGFLKYEIIDSVNNTSKSDLFFYASSFIIDNFNSPNDIIQMNDSIRGIIAGSARTSITGESRIMLTSIPYEYQIPYKFKIQVKENKYKIEIYNIEIGIDGHYGPLIKESNIDKLSKQSVRIMYGNYSYVDKYCRDLLDSIKKYIHKYNEKW